MSEKHTASSAEQATGQRGILFVASCMALIATAMAFAIRGDILADLGQDFVLTDTQNGFMTGAWGIGFAVMIALGGMFCDVLGMSRVLYLACASHIVGTLMMILAPSYGMLCAGNIVIGVGNGLVEAAVNPLIATIYADRKVKMLTLLHAWFPGGIVIGGLICYGFKLRGITGLEWEGPMIAGAALKAWQIKLAVLLVPSVIYGLLFAGRAMPQTERKAAGVSTKAMWQAVARPLFILLALSMACTAAIELGTNSWMPTIMAETIPDSVIGGILSLAWVNLIMCVGRLSIGGFAHKTSPTAIIMISAAVAGVGLVLMAVTASSPSLGLALLSTGVFAAGICFFWPTMLGIVSERFPSSGAVGLGLMGGMGAFAAFLAPMGIGAIRDAGNLGHPLLWVAGLAIYPVILFASIILKDKKSGGYQAIEIESDTA